MNNKIDLAKNLRLRSRWDESLRESHLLKTGESKTADVKELNEQLIMSRRPTRLSLLRINNL